MEIRGQAVFSDRDSGLLCVVELSVDTHSSSRSSESPVSESRQGKGSSTHLQAPCLRGVEAGSMLLVLSQVSTLSHRPICAQGGHWARETTALK